jgi:hypothetical protein
MSALRAASSLLLSAILAALFVAVAVAAPARAVSVVPRDVTEYIATQLVDDLNEFYGPGTEGKGMLFTNTTTATGGTRVFVFTADFLAGVESDPAVKRLNTWVSVISIDKAVVGFALLSIDPVTDTVLLDSFTESPDFGTVVAALPETATLVRDEEREAWFGLEEAELTPIVAGTSRVTEPISLADYREVVANWPRDKDVVETPADTSGAFLIIGLVAVLIILLLAVERFLPFWRKRAKGEDAVAEAEPVAEPEPEPEPKAKPKRQPKTTTQPEPEPATDAPVKKPRAPRAKPPASTAE